MVESPVGAMAPSYFCGSEGDLGVVRDVEDVVIHFFVAAGLAAAAAACCNNNRTGDGVRGAIEIDRSALHVEGAGDMVAVAAESPCDLAGGGIDGEGLVLCEGAGGKKQRGREKGRAEKVFQCSSPEVRCDDCSCEGCAVLCASQRLSEATSLSGRYSWPVISELGIPNLMICAK